ncbi:MAG: hypothetical protein RIE52_15210 [Balneola sp.]|jgi:hypothetical protein
MKVVLRTLIFSVIVTSCSIFESDNGPCIHSYDEPVLEITSAISAEDDSPIEEVVISEVTIDSVLFSVQDLTLEFSENIIVKDSVLICSIPCGFGTNEGIYELTFSAQGYFDLTISTLAEYDNKKGGCPSSSSGSHHLGFSLYPKPN